MDFDGGIVLSFRLLSETQYIKFVCWLAFYVLDCVFFVMYYIRWPDCLLVLIYTDFCYCIAISQKCIEFDCERQYDRFNSNSHQHQNQCYL